MTQYRCAIGTKEYFSISISFQIVATAKADIEVPADWYRSGFPLHTTEMPWADRTLAEVDRAIGMLQPQGSERILDLACGIGRHSRELASRGFDVVGLDISAELLEIAAQRSLEEGLDIEWIEADLREIELEDEFDIVLSLNDGAVGYFETDEENYRTFEVVSKALRSGGGHLMQLPNVLHAEKHLPKKTWIAGEATVELSDHRWNAKTRYLEGFTVPIQIGEVFERFEPIPFRQRLYSIEELTEIYDSVGMRLANVFRGTGKPRMPRDNQYEVFVEGRKN
jgi:SAM-dependent methyltransferase